MYYVYILQCNNGTLYTGITTDVERRFNEHQRGIGSNYTRSNGAHRIVYVEKQKNRSAASKREAAIKKLSRKSKLALFQK